MHHKLKIYLTTASLLLIMACSSSAAHKSQYVKQAEPQGHMRAALVALNKAENQLRQASRDKGGHRVKALELIEAAKRQVKKGIEYDNRH